jgi:hypothetical protein
MLLSIYLFVTYYYYYFFWLRFCARDLYAQNSFAQVALGSAASQTLDFSSTSLQAGSLQNSVGTLNRFKFRSE